MTTSPRSGFNSALANYPRPAIALTALSYVLFGYLETLPGRFAPPLLMVPSLGGCTPIRGMLATRYALLFPAETVSLTLLNPIGLEGWAAAGVPYSPIEAQCRQELAKTPERRTGGKIG